MKWIKLSDYEGGHIPVHEVKCPICNSHETYIGDKIPSFCYVCEERMVDDEET